MFEKIFIEKEIENTEKVKSILAKFPKSSIFPIENIDDLFQRTKKPYLQKRDSLNLYLGYKRGQLVKVAPDAYGLSGDPHYYFVHAYNCIYECDYCYLQGYFHSPDIVLYLNHEQIGEEIAKISNAEPSRKMWFHAGEYSDSLALAHISGEINYYFNLFKNLPNSYLELRTKSVNIKPILLEQPLANVITSFSLAPLHRSISNDLKTPNTNLRLTAIKKLHQNNYPIAIHFDPIIYDDILIDSYTELIELLNASIPLSEINYISLGVVRFTKDVYRQFELNYPNSNLRNQEFIKSFDNKIRYSRPMRMWILQKIKSLLVDRGMNQDKIYFCMEDQ